MNRLQLGASSYFSRPSNILDPHLFDGEHLKPHVREVVNNFLLDYLNSCYSNASAWTMVWLAGSGISYQWSADRGNGDLDVLFGIDYDKFIENNPEFEFMDRHEIAEHIDNDLKKNLWPSTASIPFYFEDYFEKYEITFFLNEYVEADSESITNIHPYAAYNITKDEWTIKPPRADNSPNEYPKEYEEKAQENKKQAKQLIARHAFLIQQLSTTSKNSPQWHNYQSSMTLLMTFIRTMFDEIHLGRKKAFSNQGEGYGDFYNYQWQAAKRDGIINAFNEILHMEH